MKSHIMQWPHFATFFVLNKFWPLRLAQTSVYRGAH